MFLGVPLHTRFGWILHRSKVYHFRGRYNNNQTIFKFHFRRLFICLWHGRKELIHHHIKWDPKPVWMSFAHDQQWNFIRSLVERNDACPIAITSFHKMSCFSKWFLFSLNLIHTKQFFLLFRMMLILSWTLLDFSSNFYFMDLLLLWPLISHIRLDEIHGTRPSLI